MELFEVIWLIVVSFVLWFLACTLIEYVGRKGLRKDATKRSRHVILWEVAEKVAPLMPDFFYNPKDLVFVGKWVDYVIFDGLSNWSLQKIVFLEVKSWKAAQNNNEKQIQKCIQQNHVSYELYRCKI